jgi:hypothetical protein
MKFFTATKNPEEALFFFSLFNPFNSFSLFVEAMIPVFGIMKRQIRILMKKQVEAAIAGARLSIRYKTDPIEGPTMNEAVEIAESRPSSCERSSEHPSVNSLMADVDTVMVCFTKPTRIRLPNKMTGLVEMPTRRYDKADPANEISKTSRFDIKSDIIPMPTPPKSWDTEYSDDTKPYNLVLTPASRKYAERSGTTRETAKKSRKTTTLIHSRGILSF